jgi:hypothetical protein
MPHLPPAHNETSKYDSPNETKIKEKQKKTISDSNSNLAKSMTHHNQTKELTTWFLTMDQDNKPVWEHQQRLNNTMREVVKKEMLKLLKARIIYPVSDSEWVSPQQTVIGWHMCIGYRKLNKATRKDNFPLPFIDEMLERLANHSFFCYLDGYFGYHQISIHPDDQSKTAFTCPHGTFAYR